MPVFKRTTIIINELSREQCIAVPPVIRADIDALIEELHLTPSPVETWSPLPSLSRLVIIIDNEPNADTIHKYLQSKHPELKIHLSESLTRRHKSFDATLTTPVSPKNSMYEEKAPAKSDDEEEPSPKKKVLLDLRLDTKGLLKADGTVSPMSPTITIETVDQ